MSYEGLKRTPMLYDNIDIIMKFLESKLKESIGSIEIDKGN